MKELLDKDQLQMRMYKNASRSKQNMIRLGGKGGKMPSNAIEVKPSQTVRKETKVVDLPTDFGDLCTSFAKLRRMANDCFISGANQKDYILGEVRKATKALNKSLRDANPGDEVKYLEMRVSDYYMQKKLESFEYNRFVIQDDYGEYFDDAVEHIKSVYKRLPVKVNRPIKITKTGFDLSDGAQEFEFDSKSDINKIF